MNSLFTIVAVGLVVLVVFGLLRREGSIGALPPRASPSTVEGLLAAGRKIEAIKLYREQHGVGLKEAKEAVEAIAAGRAPA